MYSWITPPTPAASCSGNSMRPPASRQRRRSSRRPSPAPPGARPSAASFTSASTCGSTTLPRPARTRSSAVRTSGGASACRRSARASVPRAAAADVPSTSSAMSRCFTSVTTPFSPSTSPRAPTLCFDYRGPPPNSSRRHCSNGPRRQPTGPCPKLHSRLCQQPTYQPTRRQPTTRPPPSRQPAVFAASCPASPAARSRISATISSHRSTPPAARHSSSSSRATPPRSTGASRRCAPPCARRPRPRAFWRRAPQSEAAASWASAAAGYSP